ncbi:MAG: citrate lyase ACP [Acidobacteria bacterium]|nr:MAG: citrate lyase ACP [Acidobacteriota bacterium]
MATETKTAQIAEAGHWGKDVRSDLHVSLEPRDSGGLEIALQSRVAAYYGDSIVAQTREVLSALGVEHAQLSIHDEGALPFVIAARIEAAVSRAGCKIADKSARATLEKVALPRASGRDRLRRSRLYLPGSEPKYFINAALHGPDAIILDLEDSVHPGEKDAARILVRNTLRAVDFGACERMVRINQLPLGLEDLAEVIPEAPDLVLIPKVEHADQVVEVDHVIAELKAAQRSIWLMPILESALGIENAFAIAMASPNVAALTIGLEDYTADMGVAKTSEGRESLYARTRLVNAARAAGVQAIDSVFGDVGDMDGLRRWGESSRALGFEGMGCIHPSQIRVIHEAFAPSQSELEKALKIVAAFEDAQAHGLGVVSLGSKMIDAPVVERARKLVERARKIGNLDQH